MQQNLSGRYAAVAATLALLVSVGGTSYAAVQIGTAQLKNNAVTSPKVKNGAITGADVKESSLATVPRAATVGGIKVSKVSFRPTGNAGPTTVFSARGLVVTATCAASELTLVATTTKASSYIAATVMRDSNPGNPLQTDLEGSDFSPGDTFDLLVGDDGDTNHIELAYSAGDGSVVTGVLDTDEGLPPCLLVGFLTSA